MYMVHRDNGSRTHLLLTVALQATFRGEIERRPAGESEIRMCVECQRRLGRRGPGSIRSLRSPTMYCDHKENSHHVRINLSYASSTIHFLLVHSGRYHEPEDTDNRQGRHSWKYTQSSEHI